MRYRLGDFQFDVTQQRLIGPRGPVELRRMSLRVLQVLIERAPAVVAKDALIDAVWGHAALSASSLPQTIKELRQALGDDPEALAATVLMGHSVGVQAAMRALARLGDGRRVRGLLCVAGWWSVDAPWPALLAWWRTTRARAGSALKLSARGNSSSTLVRLPIRATRPP